MVPSDEYSLYIGACSRQRQAQQYIQSSGRVCHLISPVLLYAGIVTDLRSLEDVLGNHLDYN